MFNLCIYSVSYRLTLKTVLKVEHINKLYGLLRPGQMRIKVTDVNQFAFWASTILIQRKGQQVWTLVWKV